MKNQTGNIVLVVLAIGLGAGVWWQVQANTLLHEERVRLQTQASELAQLKAAHAQQRAALLSPTELKKLQDEADEAGRLRSSLEMMKAAEATLAVSKTPPGLAEKKAEPVWRNVGQATPSDTLHSVICAAVNGDIDTLLPMLAFDPESRAAAEALHEWLPEETRAQYPTVEKLIATMISGRMSADLSRAQLIEQINETPDLVSARFQLQRTIADTKEPRNVSFRFQRNGPDWTLLVPKSVVAEYWRSLGGKPQN
jgi:hypothetical protein